MSDSLTFKGFTWRVQLKVFDFKNFGADTFGGPSAGKVHFAVSILPKQMPSATAFSAGTTVYYGESFQEAVSKVRAFVGRAPKLPDKWRKLYENQTALQSNQHAAR